MHIFKTSIFKRWLIYNTNEFITETNKFDSTYFCPNENSSKQILISSKYKNSDRNATIEPFYKTIYLNIDK